MTVQLKPHQQRVLEELQQLQERHDKLGVFLRSELATRVDPEEINLMTMQLTAMRMYSQTLAARVQLWLRDLPVSERAPQMAHILGSRLGG